MLKKHFPRLQLHANNQNKQENFCNKRRHGAFFISQVTKNGTRDTTKYMPLADILRPTSLHEYIGQTHLVGENAPLKNAIEQKHLFSFVLWGPPGVGKTTLARIYARAMNATIFEISAVSAGKDDIRKIVALQSEQKKILFIDEIHRFNKAQQDYLLPFVENGELTVIGATTENPSFEIIRPLLSRCRVFILQPLTDEELLQIILHSNYPVVTPVN
jgi:putative ATPase